MTYLAANIFPADGSRTYWDFEFAGVTPGADSGTTPYLYAADVKALELYRLPDGSRVSAARTVYIDPALPLRANIVGAPIAAGREVKIYRDTEIRFPLVDYRDRQTVSEFDLDLANRQAIFVAQETQDAASDGILLDQHGNFDAQNRRIVNLAPGSDPTDAVNVDQFRHSLRVPASEPGIAELPAAAARAGRLLTFDGAGLPLLQFPTNESALALAIRLASAAPGDGGDIVGWTDLFGNARTVTSGLQEHQTRLTAVEAAVLDVLYKGENLDLVAGSSLERGSTVTYINHGNSAGSFRAGGSDLTDLNDELGFWRGLPSRNAWGDLANMGFCSVSFNRNGASAAAYSSTFGHDCVAYGTASAAFGAGSCTGNPDIWKLGGPAAGFTGYCSLAFGKNVYVPGEKAVGIGEANVVDARASFGIGYRVEVRPSLTAENPVGCGGIGREINTFGEGYGLGQYISASDSMVLGYGANPGSPAIGQGAGEVGLVARTVVPGVRVLPPTGPGRGKVLLNTTRSSGFVGESEVVVSLGDGKTLSINGDGFGIYNFDLRGLKGDGTSQSITKFSWSNPNSGSADGTLSVFMNGRATSALSILANGTPVFGELKNATTISGSPSGSVYQDGGVLKVVI